VDLANPVPHRQAKERTESRPILTGWAASARLCALASVPAQAQIAGG
jgi:hypothetical protein